MMKNPDCYQVMAYKYMDIFLFSTNIRLVLTCPFFSNEDYVYHTLAAKASGELCLKYIFAFGAFTRMPLLQRFDNFTFFNLKLLYTFFWVRIMS